MRDPISNRNGTVARVAAVPSVVLWYLRCIPNGDIVTLSLNPIM